MTKNIVIHGISYIIYSTVIPAWISNLTHSEVWDEITYPLPNFNGVAVDFFKWISNVQHIIMDVITHVIHAGIKVNRCW